MNTFLDQKQEELSQKGAIHLQIKVKASSSKNEFVELLNDESGTLKIRIKSPADKGKANKEIVKFIEKYFSGTCEIVSGHTNNVKLLKIIQ